MILIISADDDTMTDAICAWLSFLNKKFVRLSENQLITAVVFDFKADVFKIDINGLRYDLKDFQSVFYRNGSLMYNGFKAEIDSHLKDFFNSELKSLTHFIYYYLEKSGAKIYGNIINKEVNKLEVLHLAQTLGFKIPDTYVISQLIDVSILNASENYITKSISEVKPIFYENDLYLNYTKEINLKYLNTKNENIIPSLIQNKINKIYEVRAFFFEKTIWAIATFEFSDNIDGRSTREGDKKYLPLKLPKDIKLKIRKLAKILRLKCGTIDMLKNDKNFYFLEINPLGQFHPVSHYGNYQIEKYIADLL